MNKQCLCNKRSWLALAVSTVGFTSVYAQDAANEQTVKVAEPKARIEVSVSPQTNEPMSNAEASTKPINEANDIPAVESGSAPVSTSAESAVLPGPVSAQDQKIKELKNGDRPDSHQVLYDLVVNRARDLASKSYVADANTLPASLDQLNYQQYRSIRYNPEKSIWKNESDFEIQLFHPGFLYKHPVGINLVDEYSVHQHLNFDPQYFLYEREAENLTLDSNNDVGFAGFRIHYPLNSKQYKDEIIVFQGASYFRPVGPGQNYGISARGLAVDTGELSGEEFPTFKEFWLKKPKTENSDNSGTTSNQLQVVALLDSPSVTGAYKFTIHPEVNTIIDVRSTLFFRSDIKKLGVAPLTSMFLFGENKTRFYDDFRPEVHDSDGLQILTQNGEWIWRPLRNPKQLGITSSGLNNVRGFGLAQRDRDSENYLDTEAHYEYRPSLWIEPKGDWGEGRVELVEIPTNSETNDNIVAYWVPKQPVKAGESMEFSYRLSTFNEFPKNFQSAYVEKTRIGWAAIPGQDNPPPKAHRQFLVDFVFPETNHLNADWPVNVNLELNGGSAKDVSVKKLPNENRWRVMFKVSPQNQDAIDMRLNLTLHGKRVSEVWNYVWSPNAIQ